MDCALWLNRRKIFTAAEISGNLDVASLRGYLLAGTLIEWLDEHGGKRYAAMLSKLSPDDEKLGEKIAEIFGASSAPYKELKGETAPDIPQNAPPLPDISPSSLLSSYPIGSAGSYNYAAISSFGSFWNYLTESSGAYYLSSFAAGSGGSFEWEQWLSQLFGYGSFSMGSFGSFSFSQWEWLYKLLFGYGSFTTVSYEFGSFGFSQWEWEWLFKLLYGYGSFTAESFSSGGFSQWEWLYKLLYGYGSFTAESFSSGSFSQWEWLYKLLFGYGSFSLESLLSLFKNYGSFAWGSFGFFGGSGSFGSYNTVKQEPGFFLDEYDLIMLRTLANCPLDRFGYGIHNI